MKLNTKTKFGCVGVASSAAMLGLVAMAVVCPGVDGVFAADSTHTQDLTVGFAVNALSGTSDPMLKEGNLNVSFTVNPYIEISTAPGNVAITTDTPTSSGVTKPGSTTFAVRTNSSTGFDVYVKASNAALSSANSTNTATIGAIASDNLAIGSFGANTWGYAVTASDANPSTYRKPTTGDVKAYYTTTFSSDATNLKLNFGTKVTDTLPSDTYSTTVTISAVLPGAAVASLSDDTPVLYSADQEIDEGFAVDESPVVDENSYEAYSDDAAHSYDGNGYEY